MIKLLPNGSIVEKINNRKEEIINATLRLESVYGLKAVSMSMIAKEVGIKKPSLYNHFSSKEQLINEMYNYLRSQAKQKTLTEMPKLEGNDPFLILTTLVNNYIALTSEESMLMFYSIIYSERTTSSEAAKIMIVETEKMINMTKYIFKELEQKKVLNFKNLEMDAMSFAFTIHGLMDYEKDCKKIKNANNQNLKIRNKIIILFRENEKKSKFRNRNLDFEN